MRLILAAYTASLGAAFEQHCGDLPHVDIRYRLPFDTQCQAVVSPGNSFGFMCRGIDLHYVQRFGQQVEDRLRRTIRSRYHGELLVGQAEIVETGDKDIPYLIAAPTTRLPNAIPATADMYLSMRATLLLLEFGILPDGPNAGCPVSQKIDSVAFTLLDGDETPFLHVHQMRVALDASLRADLAFPASVQEACNMFYDLWRLPQTCDPITAPDNDWDAP